MGLRHARLARFRCATEGRASTRSTRSRKEGSQASRRFQKNAISPRWFMGPARASGNGHTAQDGKPACTGPRGDPGPRPPRPQGQAAPCQVPVLRTVSWPCTNGRTGPRGPTPDRTHWPPMDRDPPRKGRDALGGDGLAPPPRSRPSRPAALPSRDAARDLIRGDAWDSGGGPPAPARREQPPGSPPHPPQTTAPGQSPDGSAPGDGGRSRRDERNAAGRRCPESAGLPAAKGPHATPRAAGGRACALHRRRTRVADEAHASSAGMGARTEPDRHSFGGAPLAQALCRGIQRMLRPDSANFQWAGTLPGRHQAIR